ncbi:hypothetical protein [Chryseobacterium sp. Mn2064]|uniref:hypothetical protein n=1 Tax=Chryseobacterium sp. Mn2064 TaxID=3395263 RepID=UPI003BC1D238
MQVFINEQETDFHHISYDEYYFEKYIEGKEISQFEIRIPIKDFNEKMKPKYEELRDELIEDDEKVGENFALELFETLTEYPSYDEILIDTKVNMAEKMGFMNTFFISQIFKEYLNEKNPIYYWIIRGVFYFNQIGDYIIIKGNVQRID